MLGTTPTMLGTTPIVLGTTGSDGVGCLRLLRHLRVLHL